MSSHSDHSFGGPWTLIKLDILGQYLRAFCTALKHQPFRLVYIDAFAGSGTFTPKSGEAEQIGSVRIALETPGFHRYCFVERHARRFKQLEALKREYPRREIVLRKGDTNQEIPRLLDELASDRWRGVIFLDPYGLNVDWSTLLRVQRSEILDVWYLFSLSGLYRQAALDLDAVDDQKAAALDRTLGTAAWRDAWYSVHPQGDLFGGQMIERIARVDALESFVLDRLQQAFPAVLKPLRLPRGGAPMYSLFFAVSNPNPAAIGPAQRIAKHILDHA